MLETYLYCTILFDFAVDSQWLFKVQNYSFVICHTRESSLFIQNAIVNLDEIAIDDDDVISQEPITDEDEESNDRLSISSNEYDTMLNDRDSLASLVSEHKLT